MFSDSAKTPSSVAPSPKKVSATRDSPLRANAQPVPTATEIISPRMAPEPANPTDWSMTWIDPPRPCEQPSCLPYSSATSARRSPPLARYGACVRCAAYTQSRGVVADSTPTAVASWPIEKWMAVRISCSSR